MTKVSAAGHMPLYDRAFLDDAPVGLCIVKRDRNWMEVLYANPSLARMIAAPDAAALIGQPLAKIWPGHATDELVRKLKSQTPPEDFTLSVHDGREDQPKRWAYLAINSTIFEGVDAFALWATDISQSKIAEARMQEALEHADAMAEMKTNFLATMSHEIRTPMQSVYGMLELIGEEALTPNIRDMVKIARTSANGLLEILDDILDIAKIDADKMELDVFEVPVRTLARGIIEALAVRVQGKQIALIDDIAPDVPPVIIGDPKRLRQILMNFMSNALKFTEHGSVTLRVTTRTQALQSHEDGIALRFEVIDTGMGMSPEVRERLFQPFAQADASTSRKFGGTGLGLSICKKLVRLMGGEIGVESVKGVGSVFWFEIQTEQVRSDSATALDLPKLDGISVLSVEPHPQGAREIVNSLRSMGASIEHCTTLAEATDLVAHRPFDVAIVDQGLPDGLGLDLIKSLVRIRPNMGIIMYTARDDIGLQHSLKAIGVPYVPKPASRRGLGEAVLQATSRRAPARKAGTPRLLIAEDTQSVRDVIKRQLETLGVEARFVTTGVEALAVLSSGDYGILFTDLHMPEMDGYELVKKIRDYETEQRGDGPEDPQPFPVIALTADVQIAQRHVYMRYGFDECLLKPVSLGQLKHLLIRWGLLSEDEADEPARETQEISPHTPDLSDSDLWDIDEEDGEAAQKAAPAFDRDAYIHMMGGSDGGADEILSLFVAMSHDLFAALDDAWNAQDLPQIREIAHSLKGSARTACCPALGMVTARLQSEAEAGNGPACGPLIEQAKIEFERVRLAADSMTS